jgi:SIS domain
MLERSALTAIANDYGYETVFARQFLGIGRSGDILIALSTSGNSESVIRASATARQLGIGIIGLTGSAGGKLREVCDICICVPANETNHIQEMHCAIGHYLCGFVEKRCAECCILAQTVFYRPIPSLKSQPASSRDVDEILDLTGEYACEGPWDSAIHSSSRVSNERLDPGTSVLTNRLSARSAKVNEHRSILFTASTKRRMASNEIKSTLESQGCGDS